MPTIFDEETFIMRIHDAQMKSSDKTQELYYAMHKVMSPWLMRAIAEARDSDSPKLSAETLIAFVEYTASTIVALSGIMGGVGPENQKNREGLANNLLSELTSSIKAGIIRARSITAENMTAMKPDQADQPPS